MGFSFIFAFIKYTKSRTQNPSLLGVMLRRILYSAKIRSKNEILFLMQVSYFEDKTIEPQDKDLEIVLQIC